MENDTRRVDNEGNSHGLSAIIFAVTLVGLFLVLYTGAFS